MLGKCSYINPNISEFFLAEWDSSIVPIYSSNNVILRYEWVVKDWFEIKINTASIIYSQQMSTSNPQGIIYDEKIQIIIPKAENSKWLELVDVLTKKYIVIFKDGNDVYFTAGYRYGIQVKAYQLSDNEYVISFECPHSNNLPTFIDENYVKNNVWILPTPSPSPTSSPSPTPSPSITPSITPSPSVSPSIGTSPSPTPSISVSRTPSVTPSLSPSPSITPSITPSVSPSIPASYNYAVSYYSCSGGSCGSFISSGHVTEPYTLVNNKWYQMFNGDIFKVTAVGGPAGTIEYIVYGPVDTCNEACVM